MPEKLAEEQRLKELKEWYFMLYMEYHRLSTFMKILAMKRLCELKDYDACMVYEKVTNVLERLAKEENDKKAQQMLEDLRKIGTKYECE
ncbi:MAG: hypothetical protein QXX75_05065 [Thermoplasmatales archaeon]